MPQPFTYDNCLAALEAVLADPILAPQGGNTVYRAEGDTGSYCFNTTPPSETDILVPHCIIAAMCLKMGYTLPDVDSSRNQDGADHLLYSLGGNPSDQLANALSIAQYTQDTGGTWAQAIADMKAAYDNYSPEEAW